ncbi:hypothetical protein SAMN04487962_1532 [Marinobacter segnicrescens]|uniref:Uncharacterized protein n=1 Tax=Marinobacter segnicrescens TaxID=430453 RepID=A0A1I0IDJ4_9GAMM|nr:hypothetical protein [Marinobacter segnicrescens]SET94001.1 hypothetical protein SAMN04487962_1532 [Marinobacter segnicrescens]
MTFSTLLGICFLFILIGWVLFVLFGQITVRTLRKNPETRDKLGLDFASGWDIFNVAGAMCRPHWLSERLRRSTLSFTAADERPIYENTNWFDRLLGRTMFIMMMGAVAVMLVLILLNFIGLVD